MRFILRHVKLSLEAVIVSDGCNLLALVIELSLPCSTRHFSRGIKAMQRPPDANVRLQTSADRLPRYIGRQLPGDGKSSRLESAPS